MNHYDFREETCKTCHDTGFSGYGTGYGDVCSDCGGQSAMVKDCYVVVKDSYYFPEECMVERWENGILVGCNYIPRHFTSEMLQERIHAIKNLGRCLPRTGE